MADEERDLELDYCDCCNEPVLEGQPWVLLNRFVVGTGASTGMTEITCNDEYVWHMREEWEGPDASECSGWLLHYPNCLQMYLEGRMVEVDYMTAKEQK